MSTTLKCEMPANHLKTTTDRSYGIDPTDSRQGCDNMIWLPKQFVNGWTQVDRVITFEIPEWLIDQRGLRSYPTIKISNQ